MPDFPAWAADELSYTWRPSPGLDRLAVVFDGKVYVQGPQDLARLVAGPGADEPRLPLLPLGEVGR
jgi:hypothetical protein